MNEETEKLVTDAVTKAIRDNCANCRGTGVMDYRPATYVSADMASDAGDPSLQGTPYAPEQIVQCEYCGRQISAVLAALKQVV
jgi:hypothetical protein